jgi:hypothetical protein
VDKYTRRAFRRLAVFPELGEGFWAQPYDPLKGFFEGHLLADLSLYKSFELAAGVRRDVALLRDFHAQVIELGKHHCLRRHPCCACRGRNGWRGYAICETHCGTEQCSACPLRRLCKHGTDSRQSAVACVGPRRRKGCPRQSGR